MNKFIIVVCLFLQSVLAFALPSVGDYAKYKIIIKVNGQVEFDGYETQLLKSFDATTGTFVQVSENAGMFVGSHYVITPYSEKIVDMSDLSDDAYLNDVVSNCQNSFNGTIVQIAVSEHPVTTCKQNIQGNIGTTGLGVVPFGWVFFKYALTRGDLFEVEQKLVEFKLGQ